MAGCSRCVALQRGTVPSRKWMGWRVEFFQGEVSAFSRFGDEVFL